MPLLIGLFLGAMAGQGFSAVTRINLQAVLAALQDPLSLFAQRSPGKRASGKLHPTKSIKGRPHERVLAAVRDRPAAPPGESPNFGDVPPSSVTIPIIPPEYDVPPEGPVITGTPPFPLPPIPFVPIDNPGPPINTPAPPPGTPEPPLGTPVPPPGTPPPGTPPPGTPPPGTPPPGTPTPPPESPPGIIITVPEPASWTMMLLGVLAIGVARRRLRKPVAVRWRSHG